MVLPEQQQYIPSRETIGQELLDLNDAAYSADFFTVIRLQSPELPQRENKSDEEYTSALTATLKKVNELITQALEIENKAKADTSPDTAISVQIITRATERKTNELMVLRRLIESILLKAALDPQQVEELTRESVAAATQELTQEVEQQREQIQQLEQEKQRLEDENAKLKEELDKLKAAPPVATPAAAPVPPAEPVIPTPAATPETNAAVNPVIEQIAKTSEKLAATTDVQARWAILRELDQFATDKGSDAAVKKAAYDEKKKIVDLLKSKSDWTNSPQDLADLGLAAEDAGQRSNYLRKIIPLYKSGAVDATTPPNPAIIDLIGLYNFTYTPNVAKKDDSGKAAPAAEPVKPAPESTPAPVSEIVAKMLISLQAAIDRRDRDQILALAEEIIKDDPDNEKAWSDIAALGNDQLLAFSENISKADEDNLRAWQNIAELSPIETRKRGAEQRIVRIRRKRASGEARSTVGEKVADAFKWANRWSRRDEPQSEPAVKPAEPSKPTEPAAKSEPAPTPTPEAAPKAAPAAEPVKAEPAKPTESKPAEPAKQPKDTFFTRAQGWVGGNKAGTDAHQAAGHGGHDEKPHAPTPEAAPKAAPAAEPVKSEPAAKPAEPAKPEATPTPAAAPEVAKAPSAEDNANAEVAAREKRVEDLAKKANLTLQQVKAAPVARRLDVSILNNQIDTYPRDFLLSKLENVAKILRLMLDAPEQADSLAKTVQSFIDRINLVS